MLEQQFIFPHFASILKRPFFNFIRETSVFEGRFFIPCFRFHQHSYTTRIQSVKNQRHLCSRWLVSHQHLLPWNVGSAPENGPQAQSTDLQPHIPLFCCNDGGVVGRGVGSGWDPWDGRDRWLGSCANKIRHLNESNPSANVEYKNGLRRNVCVYSIRTRRFQFHIGPRVFPPIFKSLLMCGIWSRFSSLIQPLGCASFFTME